MLSQIIYSWIENWLKLFLEKLIFLDWHSEHSAFLGMSKVDMKEENFNTNTKVTVHNTLHREYFIL